MSGQLEILPASEAAWCRQQFSEIAAFAARHEHPGGGWTDVYRRPPAPRLIQHLAIAFVEAEAAMARRLPHFDEVIGGSGSVMTPVAGMRAYGPSPHAGIGLIGDTASGIVTWVEVVLRCSGPEAAALLGALAALPSREPLILVDWPQARIVDLSRPDEIRRHARAGGE